MKKLKLLILGLDGADFCSLRKWIDSGYMPALKSIIATGASATLQSTIPPMTAPAWTSFMTGKNPGNHGIFSFFNYEEGFENPKLNRLNDIKAQKIWNYLNHNGFSAGVADLPMTYPPEPLHGIMVSNLLTSGNRGASTYPEDLKDELVKNLGVSLKYAILDKLSQSASYLEHLIQSVEVKKKIDLYLIDRYKLNCFITVYSHLDTLQHYFWRYFDASRVFHNKNRSRKFEKYFKSFFRKIDEAISESNQFVDEDGYIVVVSDHGFGPISRVANINRFLFELGYLSLKRDTKRQGKDILPLKLDYRKLLNFFSKIDIFNIKGKLSKELREKIRKKVEGSLTPLIDFNNSLAFFGHPMDQGIFINKRHQSINNSEKKYSEIREEIKSVLSSLKDPYHNVHVFENVYDREELYHGKYVNSAPDIIFKITAGYFCQSGITSKNIIEEQSKAFVSGSHRPKGIFVARGRNLSQGKKLSDLNMIDVLPTVLSMLGSKIPEELEGHVARGIFE
jgi:predicted AlkP superfamily phosphohydrolase/phosphomutase